MPELPEVETARRLIADRALHRRIVAVDDADTFVCRPHAPGELRDALLGRTLTVAQRRGKTRMRKQNEAIHRTCASKPRTGAYDINQ